MQNPCCFGGVLILGACCFVGFGGDSEAEQAAAFVHENISARLLGQSTAEFQDDADRIVNEGGMITLSSHFDGKDRYGREVQIKFSAMFGRRTDGDGWVMYLLTLNGKTVETELMSNLLKELQEKKGR